MKKIRNLLNKFNVFHLRRELRKFGEEPPFVPNGHFYSPIPSLSEIQVDKERIYRREMTPTSSGVDMKDDAQLELLKQFHTTSSDLPFADKPVNGFRYGYDNPAYSYSDAIFLHSMIRHVNPQRIIEVGSGYSSCMTLDTNEFWFENRIQCTFIEPYPQLLYSLIKSEDKNRIKIIPSRIQDVDITIFAELQQNDILFIDSTHVSKFGSDVNFLIFDIFPLLPAGVYIHFHDIFYPFEYPEEWIKRAWNEIYLLRAFLQCNSNYEVVIHNNYLWNLHKDEFMKYLPLCAKNPGGSLWLKKIAR